MSIEGYLTTGQASERFGLSADHVRRLLESRTIEGEKVGRDWLADIESLEAYMANRRKPGPRPGGKRHG